MVGRRCYLLGRNVKKRKKVKNKPSWEQTHTPTNHMCMGVNVCVSVYVIDEEGGGQAEEIGSRRRPQ